MLQIMAAGKIRTVQLSEKVTTGRQQWLQWHADFMDQLPALKQVPDPALVPTLNCVKLTSSLPVS